MNIRIIFTDKLSKMIAHDENLGQVDSPESPEMPETTAMTENFTKVTK